MNKKKQRSLNKRPVSPTVVWLAAIASTLVVVLLYAGLLWLDNQTATATFTEVPASQSGLSRNELTLIGLVLGALILGPGILVALIVLPIIRKNKKR